jgi:hypothetical protein
MTVSDPDVLDEREHQRLRRWRYRQFVDLGFQDTDASLLAEAGIDWHVAQDLVEAGCSNEHAVKILL